MLDPIDAYTRHQVYVEGFKNGEAIAADVTIDEIAAMVVLLATRLGIANLGELTKKQLRAFVTKVKLEVKRLFNKQADKIMAVIRRFMEADITLTGKIAKAVTGEAIGTAALNTDTIWNQINNAPMPGVGIEPALIMGTTLAAMLADLEQAIKRGFADGVSIAEFAASIVGTSAMRFKDGLAKKLKRRLSAAIQTTIQHVTSEVQFRLGSMQAERYTWCSILDSRTTEICRDRNGNVYEYRNGPRPPAHWGCRSFTIPTTTVELEELPTFYAWIRRQPASIQDDVLGPSRGRELRRGEIGADDLPGFDRARPLTVSDYQDRFDQILTEVA